jgi:hypothetical protein
MVAVRRPIALIALLMLLQPLLVLFWGVNVAHPNGEEPVVGVIETIAPGSDGITITVTEGPSVLTIGVGVAVHITKDTKIMDKARDTISFGKLSVGSEVRIKPNSVSVTEVEAGMVQIIKSATP